MCKDLTPFSYFCRLKINPQAHGSKAFILENLCCCEHLCICVCTYVAGYKAQCEEIFLNIISFHRILPITLFYVSKTDNKKI